MKIRTSLFFFIFFIFSLFSLSVSGLLFPVSNDFTMNITFKDLHTSKNLTISNFFNRDYTDVSAAGWNPAPLEDFSSFYIVNNDIPYIDSILVYNVNNGSPYNQLLSKNYNVTITKDFITGSFNANNTGNSGIFLTRTNNASTSSGTSMLILDILLNATYFVHTPLNVSPFWTFISNGHGSGNNFFECGLSLDNTPLTPVTSTGYFGGVLQNRYNVSLDCSNLASFTNFSFNRITLGLYSTDDAGIIEGLIKNIIIHNVSLVTSSPFPSINVTITDTLPICVTNVTQSVQVNFSVSTSSPGNTYYAIDTPQKSLGNTVSTSLGFSKQTFNLFNFIIVYSPDFSFLKNTVLFSNETCTISKAGDEYYLSDMYSIDSKSPFSLWLDNTKCTIKKDQAVYFDLGSSSYNTHFQFSGRFLQPGQFMPNNTYLNITLIAEDKHTEVAHFQYVWRNNRINFTFENITNGNEIFTTLQNDSVSNLVNFNLFHYFDENEGNGINNKVSGFADRPLQYYSNLINTSFRYVRIGIDLNQSYPAEQFQIFNVSWDAANLNINTSVFSLTTPNNISLAVTPFPRIIIYYTNSINLGVNYKISNTDFTFTDCTQLPTSLPPNFRQETTIIKKSTNELLCKFPKTVIKIFIKNDTIVSWVCPLLRLIIYIALLILSLKAAEILQEVMGLSYRNELIMILWSLMMFLTALIVLDVSANEKIIISLIFSFSFAQIFIKTLAGSSSPPQTNVTILPSSKGATMRENSGGGLE